MRHAEPQNGSLDSGLFLPQEAWAEPAQNLLAHLDVDPQTGLAPATVNARRKAFGRNQLRSIKPRSLASILLDQFRSLVILLLCFAAAAALAFGDHAEGLAVIAVIAINTAIGFFTEWRATRSMEALRQLGHFQTVVRREGKTELLSAADLVPGDIVLVDGGDIISADIRLLESSGLQADESTLTGESTPVDKHTGALPRHTPLMERSNQLFKGTSISRGTGLGVVTGTGQQTELGRIADLVSTAEAQETPLEKRLDALGQRLVWVMLLIALFIAGAGIVTGRDTVLAIEVAVALTVAAIPEGLPIVATIALARGMWRMARRNALIVRLSAVETLGATGVILTDKTGTLTENRMTATVIQLPEDMVEIEGTGLDTRGDFRLDGESLPPRVLDQIDEVLRIATLCSNAELHVEPGVETTVIGDPTENALLIAAAKRGIFRERLLETHAELREVPFDPDSKSMATFHRTAEGLLVAVKGAPESILPHCTALRTGSGDVALSPERTRRFLQQVDKLAQSGLRTLALASRLATNTDEKPYRDLVLLGAIGLLDPARPGVREAIGQCHDAGIRVVMITGDHAATAQNIALDLGLLDPEHDEEPRSGTLEMTAAESHAPEAILAAHVIARATPQQKLEIIGQYQDEGYVVAMTGDGVNDAPALKKADIGIAMGIRGTPVAKEAAAMVLQDDRFNTIVEAITHGRAIYANIRKFVIYLLSCNISEVLVVGLATIAGWPLPLLPLQILFLNLVTDVFPALALGVGEGPRGLMERAPRPANEPILTGRHWAGIGIYGTLMSATVLSAMAIALLGLGFSTGRAVSVSFCTLAFAQVLHVFNMRDTRSRFRNNEITSNAWIWAAIFLCTTLILAAVFVPGLNTLLGLENPGLKGWVLILFMSGLPLLFAPLVGRLAGPLRDQEPIH